MKIHNSQRMVIGPTFINRFVLIWVLVLMSVTILTFLLSEVLLPAAIFPIALAIFVGLLTIRGHIDNKTVIDLSTQTIVINKRSVFLKRKRRVIPFSEVKNVVINFSQHLLRQQITLGPSAYQSP